MAHNVHRRTFQGLLAVNATGFYDIWTWDLTDFRNCIVKVHTTINDGGEVGYVHNVGYFYANASSTVTPIIYYTNSLVGSGTGEFSGTNFQIKMMDFTQGSSILRQRLNNNIASSRDVTYNTEVTIVQFI